MKVCRRYGHPKGKLPSGKDWCFACDSLRKKMHRMGYKLEEILEIKVVPLEARSYGISSIYKEGY